MINRNITIVFILSLSLLIVGCLESGAPTQMDEEALEQELSELSDAELGELTQDHDDSDETAVTGEAYKRYSRAAKTSSFRRVLSKVLYSRLIEVCEDGKDNDNNGLTDCGDINNCYSMTKALDNVCLGQNNKDANKILIVGDGYGFDFRDDVKSHRPTRTKFQTGDHACEIMFDLDCKYIEIYSSGNAWAKVQQTCGMQITKNNYDFAQEYRAVCGNPTPDTPDRPKIGVLTR